MKHPLNKAADPGYNQEFLSKYMRFLDEYGVYGFINDINAFGYLMLDELGKPLPYQGYFLGDRCTARFGSWVIYEVDRVLRHKGEFESLEKAIEWVKGTQYKEYGYQLWGNIH